MKSYRLKASVENPLINPRSKNEKELVEKNRGQKLRLFVENIRLTEKLKCMLMFR